jgi:phage terminase small subunit
MSLSNKQRAFVEAYLANGFNATKAAITAGYSEKTAYSQGSRLLRNVEVSAAIEARMKELSMSADEAMYRLSQQGRGSLATFMGLSVPELKEHPDAHLLHKVKVTARIIPTRDKDKEPEREETIEYEIYNAQSALTAVLKEQHLRAGEATEITDDASFTDEDRASRITALLDRARARRDGRAGAADADRG